MEVPEDGLAPGPDGRPRCFWGLSAPEYVDYHDTEWGFPTTDDRVLFEKICLEGFQSGLSWLTILRKRENFRAAFDDFDHTVVAGYGEDEVARLLDDAGIVRHRGKIEATINNAGAMVELVAQEGSLSDFVWQYRPDEASRPDRLTWDALSEMSTTPESKALAKELKKRGWRFVGPTTAYAFMQAMGLVNDHVVGCCIRGEVPAAPG
ncbi:MAG: DNA-3-methyladenine glycosylase I [Actinomycetia bacterium]|nr:DNA-3-methyladenine glycosylase I [Actinomycetes bacterium]